MSNFTNWYNNIADMPQQDANGWYDLETGLRYDPAIKYDAKKSLRTVHSDKTISARNLAKFHGGAALKGTAKQVKWGEDIRFEKIKAMTPEDAALCCNPNGLFKSAKVWIENRTKAPSEFVSFIKKTTEIRAAYNTARENNDEATVKSLANEYNALTGSWGL